MTKPVWVIFDVGQVLYDYKKSIETIAKHLKIEEKDLYFEMDKIINKAEEGELTFEQTWKAVLKEIKLEEEFENIQRIYWSMEFFLVETRNLLFDLYEKKYKLALFTNNWPGMMQKFLDILPLQQVISEIFESSVEKLRKPDIKFYHLVESRTKAKGKEIFFIDDRPENLETARNLGWQTFLYKTQEDRGISSNQKLRKLLL